MKKVLFFGIYDPIYSRNRVLISGFRSNGWEIGECRVDPRLVTGLKKYWQLWQLGRKIEVVDWDLIIVAFPGHMVVPLARFLFPKRKIVFDAFVSLYDSNVEDRQLYSRFSIRAWRDWMVDWLACHLAPVILLDTNEHIKYFIRTFHVSVKKFIRVFVGSDYQIDPVAPINTNFIVHFHGTYIPLQGIEYIIEAAKILESENITFNIVGTGQTKNHILEKVSLLGVTNINFIGPVPMEQLPNLILKADICLGIFGNTNKTLRVIPNKVFEALACGRALITGDTPAIREICPIGQEIKMCDIANAESLAQAIKDLKDDSIERMRFAQAGYNLFHKNLTPKVLVLGLINKLGI